MDKYGIINKKKYYPSDYFIIIIYTLIIGLRYDVGVDYLGYLRRFKENLLPGDSDFEYLWASLINVLNYLEIHYSMLFIIIAFLHIFFLIKFIANYREISPFFIFFFLTSGTFFESLNGMRQLTAFFAFLNCIQFIEKRKLFKYIICVLLISLIHRSALLFLPFYFIYKKSWIPPRYIQYIVLISCFVFSELLFDYVVYELMPQISLLFMSLQTTDAGYLDSVNREDLFLPKSENSLGLARYFALITDLIIIFFSKEIISFYNRFKQINIFYNFYLIGALISYFVFNSITLWRINMYFLNFKFIILAFISYMCFYLIKRKKGNIYHSITIIMLILMYIIWFINAILKGTKNAPFEFVLF